MCCGDFLNLGPPVSSVESDTSTNSVMADYTPLRSNMSFSQGWTSPPCLGGTAATVVASLRWWNASGSLQQVKGRITLQHYTNTPLFRILYVGKFVDSDGVEAPNTTRGSVYFPVDTTAMKSMHVEHQLLQGKNSRAHGFVITFDEHNREGLTKMQIVIPSAEGSVAEIDSMLFADGLRFATSHVSRNV